MLALYRCDRQADALQAFQDARRALVDELGIEPGERLRELERAILAQDPALALPPSPRRLPGCLRRAPPSRRAAGRRLVTVLVAGAAASPALDPESRHALLDRCAPSVVERHGGAMQPFAGEAAVGMFGVPELHEDDPLRAVRAALELREARPELGVGIESGEVFVGTRARRDTSRPATRSRSPPASRLAGPPVRSASASGPPLVAQNVDAEPLEPVMVRGREAPVRSGGCTGCARASGCRSAPLASR